MAYRARRLRARSPERPVALVGLATLAAAVAYALSTGGPTSTLLFELVVPLSIGAGFVGYELWVCADERGTYRGRTVTAWAVGCGLSVAAVCAWSIALASLRYELPAVGVQPLLTATTIGIGFGGTIGHVTVERSRRHRENERLSRAVGAAMDGIAVVVDGRYRSVNGAYASFYGIPDSAAVEGAEWSDLFTNAARTTIEREVLPAVDERNYWRGRLTGRRTDGTTVPLDVTVTPLETDEGFVVVARDVSERRDREQRIQVLNRVLRHNLRNAFTVIEGHAALIGERDRTLERRHVRPIREEIDELLATADKARSIERKLDRNQRTGTTDAAAAVRSVTDRARATYPSVRIVSRIEEPGGDSELPRIDERVVDALEELVDNAVEHHSRTDAASSTTHGAATDATSSEDAATDATSSEGAPTVEIAARTVDATLEFSVTDDGDGIPLSERQAVLEGKETPLEHGSGLGLWLVNWIVENLGGEVRFTDRPRGGTMVTLALPQETSATAERVPVPTPQ